MKFDVLPPALQGLFDAEQDASVFLQHAEAAWSRAVDGSAPAASEYVAYLECFFDVAVRGLRSHPKLRDEAVRNDVVQGMAFAPTVLTATPSTAILGVLADRLGALLDDVPLKEAATALALGDRHTRDAIPPGVLVSLANAASEKLEPPLAVVQRVFGVSKKQELADLLGVSRPAVSAWLDGSSEPNTDANRRVELCARVARLVEEHVQAEDVQRYLHFTEIPGLKQRTVVQAVRDGDVEQVVSLLESALIW
jgi:hypothetical protein